MNKVFFIKSSLVAALSLSFCTLMPVTAGTQLNSEVTVVESKTLLRAKLADLKFFSANFTQKVISETGELLEESSGKLALSKPNLANWHTLEPDELAIVSDGSDVWFYNPWIEQVSVYSLSAAIAKTPILLLISKDESLWQQYTVVQESSALDTQKPSNIEQQNERFVISSIDPNSQIKNLTLVFSAKEQKDGKQRSSQLSQFSFLDATGQVSHIKLSSFDDQTVPDESLFKFTLPAEVQIDDQRVN